MGKIKINETDINENYFPKKAFTKIMPSLGNPDNSIFQIPNDIKNFVKKFFGIKEKNQHILLTQMLLEYTSTKVELERQIERNKRLSDELLNNLYDYENETMFKESMPQHNERQFSNHPIKEVTYEGNVTRVVFDDGEVTEAYCMERDTFDREKGLLICTLKKVLGDKDFKRVYYGGINVELKKYR